MAQEHLNTAWQHKVRTLLKQGLGVEDMVALHDMNRADVQEEIKILRASGELEEIYARVRRSRPYV